MKILDRFVIKSFLGPFIATFLIVEFVLMMQFLWLYIDDLVGKGLGLGVILEFLWWGSATLFPLAFPLASMLGSIMTLGALGENNELLAIKAAGISLSRTLKPLIFLSVIISISAFFASNNLIPIAWDKIYTLRDDIGRTKEEVKIPTGIFYNGVEGYTLRVMNRDKDGLMRDVMVYDHTKGLGNINLTIADSGLVKMAPDKSGIVFTLYSGINYEEEVNKSYTDTAYTLRRVNFDMQEVTIPLSNYAFKKSDKNKYGNEIMTKSISQLIKDTDSLSQKYDNTLNNQVRRALFSNNLNFTNQFDSAKRVSYKGNMNLDTLYKFKNAEMAHRAYSSALASINNQITNLDFYDKELNMTASPLRRSKLETLRKFTLSLACIIFFFIGAPLGAIIRKGGLGTPVVVSMFFFVIYWVVDISGKKLADDGAITPFIGAFISSFVLLPIGVFLTWKSTKDSALFNADAYIVALKSLFNKGKSGRSCLKFKKLLKLKLKR